MMVRPASRILRAISFGVFWRSAPSTNAIMRSRNVSPGFDVILTWIWSDSTRVPPVTAERSPPDSRITGADSPVIADSSTDATPSITSPSPGMNSPVATTTMSPERSFEPTTVSVLPSLRKRCAWVSARDLRRVSACALPRPSAMASAKFANRTVNHSQRVICSPKPNWPARRETFHESWMVVRTAPTSTTNITGFFTIVRGFSYRLESITARESMAVSASDFFLICATGSMDTLKNLSCIHQQVCEYRPETQSRKECKGAHDHDGRNEKATEEGPGNGECARGFRNRSEERRVGKECR